MAGLLAARVLSDHFNTVTVIDRDVLPETLTRRNGVPQAHHTHVLLNRGAQIIERYLPGVQSAMGEAGAPLFNFGSDLRFRTYYGWAVRPFGNIEGRRSSRSLLEWVVRRKVSAIRNVTFLPQTAARQLLTANEAVVGVDTSKGSLTADLVVDASGKASKMHAWIEGLGYTFPKPALIDGLVGYSTQVYRKPSSNGRDWEGLIIQPSPAHPGGACGGSLLPIEDNQWSVTLTGYGGNYPPVEHEGFLEFARGFRVPDMYEALKSAEPVGHVHGSRSTENRHLHLERARAWPKGFIVCGDAVVHLNPVYAQGMTLAALEAEALEKTLAAPASDEDAKLGPRFHAALNRTVQDAWAMATSVDLQVRERKGDPAPPGFAITARYMEQLMKAVCHTPAAARRFAEVIHLLRSPASLLAPSIALPVIASGVFRTTPRTSS